MKNIFHLSMLFAILALTACASKASFPVSSIAPAADISVTKRTNKQHNFTVEIVAVNLASPERLSPPGTNYSVWIVTKAHGVKNIGQLNVENAQTTTFKSITAFDFYEVFITVEQQGDLDSPRGTELCRTKI